MATAEHAGLSSSWLMVSPQLSRFTQGARPSDARPVRVCTGHRLDLHQPQLYQPTSINGRGRTYNDVDVEVVDGLRPVHAIIDHDAEAVGGEPLLLGHILGDEQEVPVVAVCV